MSETKSNSVEGLAQKYQRLPYGMVRDIANKHGVSPQLVTAVKNGRRYNPDILVSIIDELEAYEAQKKELKERINRL